MFGATCKHAEGVLSQKSNCPNWLFTLQTLSLHRVFRDVINLRFPVGRDIMELGRRYVVSKSAIFGIPSLLDLCNMLVKMCYTGCFPLSTFVTF